MTVTSTANANGAQAEAGRQDTHLSRVFDSGVEDTLLRCARHLIDLAGTLDGPEPEKLRQQAASWRAEAQELRTRRWAYDHLGERF